MTNGEAIGYAILALKSLGYTNNQIRKIEARMLYEMDMHSENDVREVYIKF